MSENVLRETPEVPASEVEWEALLERLEVGPRAIRLAVEDAGTVGDALHLIVGRAVGREQLAKETLEQLRGGSLLRQFNPNLLHSPIVAEGMTVTDLLDLFTGLRTQNFAQVQRRGIEVWEWRASRANGVWLTSYRLLTLMAHLDGETIAAVHRAGNTAR